MSIMRPGLHTRGVIRFAAKRKKGRSVLNSWADVLWLLWFILSSNYWGNWRWMGEVRQVVQGVSGTLHKPKNSELGITDIKIKVIETACCIMGLWPLVIEFASLFTLHQRTMVSKENQFRLTFDDSSFSFKIVCSNKKESI